jgi:hypothetical protein
LELTINEDLAQVITVSQDKGQLEFFFRNVLNEAQRLNVLNDLNF